MTAPLPPLIPEPRGPWTEAEGRRIVWGRAAGGTGEPSCEFCGDTRTLQWSHREARGRGGTWRASNGNCACLICHGHATVFPVIAKTLGWHLPTGADPLTVPVWMIRPWPGFWLLRDDTGPLTPFHAEDHPDIDVSLPDDLTLRTLLLPAAARGALL